MKKEIEVIIIGAGPAGLAAAHKLSQNNKNVLVIEKANQVGGISKTINYKGFRFDLGGHRFFTKSEEVNDLWKKTLGDDFLKRPRLSRIYYKNKFFNYPLKPFNAFFGLGILNSLSVILSYLFSQLFPYKEEKNFEQWVSNRFGKKLYKIFFKTYTEKLWGIQCSEIQAEWAAQRIKGLSLISAIKNAIFPDKSGKIKTLIDQFYYPKLGPGMMYEKMAENITKMGGVIIKNQEVIEIRHESNKIISIKVKDTNNEILNYEAKHFISSMPITELIKRMTPVVPSEVLTASMNLKYRSFITVSIILNSSNPFPDTWIYVHSPEVKMGRIQNFKRWSPFMVPDQSKTALGIEYFCSEGDELWCKENNDLIKLALEELEKINLGKSQDFVDGFVSRVPKAYPVYDSLYPSNIKVIRKYLVKFENLQTIGRYGMFKYNNMDHSILTGLYAADNILGKNYDIWSVNTDDNYHEEKNDYR